MEDVKQGQGIKDAQPTDEALEQKAELGGQVDVFAKFDTADDGRGIRDYDEVTRELLASGRAKRVNGLVVRNVVATNYDNYALLTFVLKNGAVYGDVRSETEVDPLGRPAITIGKTNHVMTNSFAVIGTMKDKPKLAVFADDLARNPSIANNLFAGSKIDVVLEYVPAHTEYVNPYSSTGKVTVFEREKVIHHIVSLELGEVGQDMYREKLRS